MTKSTLKALWLGGGGVLATWLAVAPDQGVSTVTTTSMRPAATSGPSAEELNSQAARLRSRTSAVVLHPSTRNPFRFSASRSVARHDDAIALAVRPAAMESPLPTAPLPPRLKLSGVAEKRTAEGGLRTAVISGDGQLYLAGVGDTVAGRYTVITIDPEAVVLRDPSGTETRLLLR